MGDEIDYVGEMLLIDIFKFCGGSLGVVELDLFDNDRWCCFHFYHNINAYVKYNCDLVNSISQFYLHLGPTYRANLFLELDSYVRNQLKFLNK